MSNVLVIKYLPVLPYFLTLWFAPVCFSLIILYRTAKCVNPLFRCDVFFVYKTVCITTESQFLHSFGNHAVIGSSYNKLNKIVHFANMLRRQLFYRANCFLH